jgi:uncharacterized protein
MTLVSVTAYHSFGGEVEASNTPTIRRLTPSCRHQLPRIAPLPNMEPDQIFLEYVIKSLVDYPDDVRVVRTVDELGVLLTLRVHKEDMGKVIGRGGQTAHALRTILRVVGVKNAARVNLKIEEPEDSDRYNAKPDSNLV